MTSAPAMSSPACLTVQQVAALLHVSAQTVEAWRAAGRLPPAICVGRRWLWLENDIRRHLQGLRTVAEAAAS
jgi:excisionase family DNA binding protein